MLQLSIVSRFEERYTRTTCHTNVRDRDMIYLTEHDPVSPSYRYRYVSNVRVPEVPAEPLATHVENSFAPKLQHLPSFKYILTVTSVCHLLMISIQ